ncbi:hypothetical protein ACX8Z9_02005 [Arthrobacter halodurans]|uniref:Uncharacterized protein n=1 Tax=Arthrobacter halodurans TaxID=516699 RepID=A0ABV4UMG2_9MICC
MPRRTLLIIIEGRLLREAIELGLRLAEEYQDLVPEALETSKSELYAVGEASRIQRRTRAPRPLADASPAATGAGALHAIWCHGRWLTPGNCPPGPPEAHGATDWQWAHYNAVMGAHGSAHLILWDLYLRATDGRLAA